MSTQTVAVAGAGIAGLTAAAVLARRGLRVTVYEKSDTPREFGAGIYLKENSLPVLEEIGAYDEIAASGVRLRAVRIADEKNRIIVTRSTEKERLITTLRSSLHTALLSAARNAGATLVTGVSVTGARPDGTLLLDGRDPVRADLVVAADGVNSAIRSSLGLTRTHRVLPTGATRLLVKREETDNVSTEYWAGPMRLGVAPCSDDLTYLFLIGPEKDARATAIPVDRDYWAARLPHLADVISRITDDTGVHHAHAYVTCTSWTSGRVAIIGDAAHAQPPNLGQGAGLAMANARKLADFVAGGGDMAEMLRAWEHHVRRGSRVVQSLTTAYDMAGTWDRALPARSQLFHRLSTFRPTARQWEYWWRGGMFAPSATETKGAA